MDYEKELQLKVYKSVQGYTIKAVEKAIKELEDSILDPQNKAVEDILKTRKKELEKTLNDLNSFCE